MSHTIQSILCLGLLIPVCCWGDSTTTVTVSGQTSGAFGLPSDATIPFVLAIVAPGPGAITVTATGCVTDVGVSCATADGFSFNGGTTPLQEAGVAGNPDLHVDGLIGALVPAAVAANPTFKPVDSSKSACAPGPCIDRGQLFFIGSSKVFSVSQPSTLYLGIDDFIILDNGGAFTVTVTFTPCHC